VWGRQKGSAQCRRQGRKTLPDHLSVQQPQQPTACNGCFNAKQPCLLAAWSPFLLPIPNQQPHPAPHSRRARCASRDCLARPLLAAAAACSSSSTAMVPHLRCAMASTSSLENLWGAGRMEGSGGNAIGKGSGRASLCAQWPAGKRTALASAQLYAIGQPIGMHVNLRCSGRYNNKPAGRLPLR